MTALTIPSQKPQRGEGAEALLARIAATLPSQFNGTALALATRNATTFSSIIDTGGATKIIIWQRLTSFGGGSGILPVIRFTDTANTVARDLATGITRLTALGAQAWCLGPVGDPTTASGDFLAYASVRVCNCILPRFIQIGVSHADAFSHDYDLTYQLLP